MELNDLIMSSLKTITEGEKLVEKNVQPTSVKYGGPAGSSIKDTNVKPKDESAHEDQGRKQDDARHVEEPEPGGGQRRVAGGDDRLGAEGLAEHAGERLEVWRGMLVEGADAARLQILHMGRDPTPVQDQYKGKDDGQQQRDEDPPA